VQLVSQKKLLHVANDHVTRAIFAATWLAQQIVEVARADVIQNINISHRQNSKINVSNKKQYFYEVFALKTLIY